MSRRQNSVVIDKHTSAHMLAKRTNRHLPWPPAGASVLAVNDRQYGATFVASTHATFWNKTIEQVHHNFDTFDSWKHNLWHDMQTEKEIYKLTGWVPLAWQTKVTALQSVMLCDDDVTSDSNVELDSFLVSSKKSPTWSTSADDTAFLPDHMQNRQLIMMTCQQCNMAATVCG